MRITWILRRFSQAFTNAPETSERFLQVAIVGPPNCGKSKLTNQLVKAEVSAVSTKMDTTQKNVTVSLTENGCQLVMVDSPGTIGIEHAREVVGSKATRILTDPELAIEHADHVLVVHDSTAVGDYIHHRVLHLLHRSPHLSSSLVMNKVDLVKRRADLLELVRILCNGTVGGRPITTAPTHLGGLGKVKPKSKMDDTISLHITEQMNKNQEWQEKYRKLMQKPTHKCGYAETKRLFADIRGWPKFDSVFYTSALTGEGIDVLRDHLLSLGKKQEHRFDKDMITTKKPQDICKDAIRGQLLDNLPGNIAYELKVYINEWRMEGEVLQIVATIDCPKEKWGLYVLGRNGATISRIGKAVNAAMQNLFKQQLFIRILVKAKGKLVELPSQES